VGVGVRVKVGDGAKICSSLITFGLSGDCHHPEAI
jgi:hypothetical protein